MMIGGCPYDDCGEPMMLRMPIHTPAMAPHDCEGCGRTIWSHFSRIDPWSMTEADFMEEYEVIEDTKTIRKRVPDPPPSAVENESTDTEDTESSGEGS